MDTRAQCFFLSRDQLDMLLLGSVVCTICEDDDVGVRSGHKPTKRQRTTIEYVHKAYSVCRKTFTFLHGVSKHKLHAIKDHFLDNGISPREHRNTGKPKGAFGIHIPQQDMTKTRTEWTGKQTHKRTGRNLPEMLF